MTIHTCCHTCMYLPALPVCITKPSKKEIPPKKEIKEICIYMNIHTCCHTTSSSCIKIVHFPLLCMTIYMRYIYIITIHITIRIL